MRKLTMLAAATIVLASSVQAQTYQVGQVVEANYGGPWMVCTVVKHNEKQADYEVSCPGRPDTFRAEDDANHIRPHAGGLPAAPAVAARPVYRPAPQAPTTTLPPLGAAPARSASNVLLGRWKLTDGECNSLILEFSARISRDYNKASGGYAAYWGQREVKYVPSPEEKAIFVVATVGGHHGKINIRDANHIVPDSMFQCTYTRM